MVHRILMGREDHATPHGAKDMAVDLLRKGTIIAAWDLSPGGFYNCVRILSPGRPRDVLTPAQQKVFDDLLDEEGLKYHVIRRNDVGSYLGVVGTLIQLPRG
jgi:hypothetical protein